MKLIGLAVLILILTAGCITTQQRKDFTSDKKLRESYVEEHQELPEDIRYAILQGEIIPGMEKKTIKDLLDEPLEKHESETGMLEIWYYQKLYIGFDKKGKVVKFEEY